MKNKPEEIPSQLFDWMQTHEFESLSKIQQEEVLMYFTQEEYNEFYFIRREIKNAGSFVVSENKEKISGKLMQLFDEKHKTVQGSSSLFSKTIVFWKAAAVFIFFMSAMSFAYVMKKPIEVITKQNTITDTVYVSKDVSSSPEKIHDTVYVYKKEESITKKNSAKSKHDMISGPDFGSENTEELDVIPVSEFESELNGTKNNSRKDDSIAKHYSLITL